MRKSLLPVKIIYLFGAFNHAWEGHSGEIESRIDAAAILPVMEMLKSTHEAVGFAAYSPTGLFIGEVHPQLAPAYADLYRVTLWDGRSKYCFNLRKCIAYMQRAYRLSRKRSARQWEWSKPAE